jgi:RND family efflux transporter MFP subunit
MNFPNTNRKNMKTTTFLIASMIATAGFLQSCSTGQSKPKVSVPTEIIPVKVISLNKQNMNAIIHSSGQFTTNNETLLSFKTSGIISSLKVKEGDFVKKGQLLSTLNLTEIETQVAQAKFGYEKAERDYQRANNLYRDSVATLEQLQNAKTALDLATQQYSAAKFNLAHSRITALEDGFVLKKLANEGQYISSGTPVIQTNGAGSNQWILKVGLSDKEWSSIKIGDKAKLETDAHAGKKLEAVVIRKSESADGVSGSFFAELKVKDQKEAPLAAGLFGKAEIYASGKQELWTIPFEALLDGNANSGFVFGTNDNKTAMKLPVEIASIDRDKVYIRKGLENVENLIVAGSPYLKENSSIQVVK